jgi:hypothetical protein
MVKTKGAKTGVFINVDGPEPLDALRIQHGNRDLLVSVAFYESADPSSRCAYGLCFRIRSSTLEQARQSALEVVYYLAENCGIPPESLDLIFNGGGIVAQNDGQANAGTAAPAEIVILVPPSVFGARPTPHALTINFDLARLMHAAGIENLDIDCYVRDHFTPLPDSIDGATGRFIVRVSPREFLYLSPRGIFDLSKRARGDDCLSPGQLVPEAAEWFAETFAEKEKQARQQSQIRDKLLGRWAVPPCIRRLDWADMSDNNALEACRVIAAFYPFVGAGEDEVWYHIHRIGGRHGLRQGARLRAIVTFGGENPAFECGHPLLRQFCPAGGCLMRELIDDLRSPRLFA